MQKAARIANGQRRPAGRNLNSVDSRTEGGGGTEGGLELIEAGRFRMVDAAGININGPAGQREPAPARLLRYIDTLYK